MRHRQTTLKNTKTLALALFLRAEGADQVLVQRLSDCFKPCGPLVSCCSSNPHSHVTADISS